MGLVAIAAALMAFLFLLFKIFDRREIPLMPAIAVNYVVALIAGLLFAPPWKAGDLSPLWSAAIGIGVLFVVTFYLTGLSTRRAGVAPTTVASRMSLVLTVAAAVILYNEDPGIAGWFGIACAIAGVALASMVQGPAGARGAWKLPALIFLGNAIIDISINWMQRMHLTPDNEAVFPTLTFVPAALVSLVVVASRNSLTSLLRSDVLIGGALLGVANYAALLMIVRALAYSGLPSSSVYPLMNVCVILFGTTASIIIFKERLYKLQWAGIALAVVALVSILLA